MAQVYKRVFFRNKIRPSDDFGLREPVIQSTFSRKCADPTMVDNLRGIDRVGAASARSALRQGYERVAPILVRLLGLYSGHQGVLSSPNHALGVGCSRVSFNPQNPQTSEAPTESIPHYAASTVVAPSVSVVTLIQQKRPSNLHNSRDIPRDSSLGCVRDLCFLRDSG